MNILQVFSISSALLCLLVTGFILTFAIVVMPGIAKLEDKDFLKAFQVTDGIIQGNQPLFLFIWLGSVISVLATMVSVVIIPDFRDARFIICVGGFYLIGVQGLTMAVHLPLNNRIKKLDINNLDTEALKEERLNFENKWNFYNKIRTAISFVVGLFFLSVASLPSAWA